MKFLSVKMEHSDREKITLYMSQLVERTRWSSLLEEKLISYKIFNGRMVEDIKQMPDDAARAKKLYENVRKRGPKAFKNLIRTLNESENALAAQILEPQFPVYNASSHSALEKGKSKVWNRPTYEKGPLYSHQLPPTQPPHGCNTVQPVIQRGSDAEGVVGLVSSSQHRPPHPTLLNIPVVPPQADLVDTAIHQTRAAATLVPSPTSPQNINMMVPCTPLKIQVKKSSKYHGLPQIKRCYPMFADPRGHALIINNEAFVNDIYTYRSGSTIDANNLDLLFEQLGFKVTVQNNRTYQDMREDINTFAQKKAHSNAQMAIIVLLSHGDDGLVFGTDGRKVPNEWILNQLNNDNSPNLKGKPKLFIFHACRGDDPDYGTTITIPRLEAGTQVDAQAFRLSLGM